MWRCLFAFVALYLKGFGFTHEKERMNEDNSAISDNAIFQNIGYYCTCLSGIKWCYNSGISMCMPDILLSDIGRIVRKHSIRRRSDVGPKKTDTFEKSLIRWVSISKKAFNSQSFWHVDSQKVSDRSSLKKIKASSRHHFMKRWLPRLIS